MNNKVLVSIISIVVIIMLFQFGYIVGKNKAERKFKVKESSSLILHEKVKEKSKDITKTPSVKKQVAVADDVDGLDPRAEMRKVQSSMSRIFSHAINKALSEENLNNIFGIENSFDPSIDIKDGENEYVVVMDVPGVDKDSLTIDVKPNYLTVSGERMVEVEEKDNDSGYYRSERRFGSFSKTIPLMQNVVPDKVEAEIKEGVLIITLPKEVKQKQDSSVNVPVK